ncbi:MAG: ABC transporter ATP-binding protein/permease [Gorillibacterium sp.]|nr:ABC transporter ATP-binding protein/permease [Gorillibacterium sp.]
MGKVKREEASRPVSKTFVRLLKLTKPYIGWYVLLCVIAACVSLTSVAMAEGLRQIINAATNKDIGNLTSISIFIFGTVIVDCLGSFAKIYLSGRLEFKSTARLQASVLSKLFRSKMREVDRYHSADLISRINDSAAAAQAGVNTKAMNLLGDLMHIVFMLTYLLSLQVSLTLGALVIATLTPLILLPFTRKLRGLYEERQKVSAEQQTYIQDVVQGAEVVRSFSLAAKLTVGFRERFGSYLRVHSRVLRIEAMGFQMPLFVILGGLLYVLGFGGYLVIRGQLDVGAVAAFLISFEQLSQPLSRVSSLWTELQTSLAQANRMFEIIDFDEEGGDVQKQGSMDLRPNSATITFDRVSFGYDDSAQNHVLKELSLVIEEGKTTAFAGPSGSGKSTVMSLLLDFYEPSVGMIRCGSTPLNEIEPSLWREEIAYVSQEPYLFSGSLYDNIAWGRKGATREEIIHAAQAAGIHDFIMSAPHAYETQIGERGLTMSGGERQRLSIARAFVRNPRILLLDEPTAALDSHNEAIVQEALSGLMRGRTTVMIAHRLSTIQDADRIYYMEDGMLLESGTHSELLQEDGKYRAMYERNRMNDYRAVVVKEAFA